MRAKENEKTFLKTIRLYEKKERKIEKSLGAGAGGRRERRRKAILLWGLQKERRERRGKSVLSLGEASEGPRTV